MNFKLNSLATKISSALLLGVIIIMVGSYFFLSSKSYEAAKSEHVKNSKQLLDFSSRNVDQYLDNQQSTLGYIAKNDVVIAGLKTGDKESLAKANSLLTVMQESRAWALTGISVMDINCVLKLGDKSVSSVVGKDFSYRDYCAGVLKEKSMYTSEVVVSVTTGTAVLTIAAPIKLNNEMIGFVVAGVNLETLYDRLPIKGGEDYYFILEDRSGNIFLDSRDGKVVKNVVVPSDPNNTGGKIYAKVKNGSQGETLEVLDKSGKNQLASFVVSNTHKVVTIIGEPIEKVVVFSNYLSSIILWSMLTALFVIFILIFGLASFLARRLNRITDVVSKISKGDITAKIESKDLLSTDEIGDLARAFERVVVSLKLAMRAQPQDEKNTK